MLTLWGFELWAVALGFARIGAVIMLLPGFGDSAVPPNARLGLALMISLIINPEGVAMPASGLAMAGVLIGEVLIGLMIGAIARTVMSALATAAQVIGLETGLAFAQTTDPTMGQAGIVVGAFLSLLGVAMIFATGMHHLFLLAIRDSYALFPANAPLPVGDAAELALRSVGRAFQVGVQIAAPLIVAGLIFRLGLGVLSRLIPSIQVFMIAMPLNILGGLMIMMLALSSGMLMWLSYVDDFTMALR